MNISVVKMEALNCQTQYVKINNHDKSLVTNFTEKIRSIVSTCIKSECEQLKKSLEKANDEIAKLRNEQYEWKALKLQLEQNTKECKSLRLCLGICNTNILTLLHSNRKTSKESSTAKDEVHSEQVANEARETNARTLFDHSYVNEKSDSSPVIVTNDSSPKETSVGIENISIEFDEEFPISPAPPSDPENDPLSIENIDTNNTLLLSKSKEDNNTSESGYVFSVSCDICNKNFKKRSDLNEHKCTDHDAVNLNCSHCGRQFNQKRNLIYHLFTKHHPESHKPYKCTKCDKRFVTRSHLEHHKPTHGPRSYKCSTCGKSFIMEYIWKRHEIEHELRKCKPHKCSICGKAFIRKSHLKQHLVMHGPKSFECSTCGKTFARKLNLKQHQILHEEQKPTPYLCSTCGKSFTFKLNLKRHQAVHAEDNLTSYKCSTCGREFSRKSNFEQHEKSHARKASTSYKCSTCGREFSRKPNLDRHEKNHACKLKASKSAEILTFDLSPSTVFEDDENFIGA